MAGVPFASVAAPLKMFGQFAADTTPANLSPASTNIPFSNDLSGYLAGSGSGGAATGGAASGAATGGFAAPAYNPALAQYDQGIGNIQSGLDRLGNQQAIGSQNIDSGFNQALNTLLQSHAQQQQQYDQGKASTAQDYVGAKNTIGGNAGNSINSLQRLLGARGAGGSSTALFGAPQAVAHQASLERAGAGQTFGKNNQAMDTSWNNYETGFGNSKQDLNRQHSNSLNSLQAGIDSTRANLLQSLATLQGQRAAVVGGSPTAAAQPYLDQANQQLSTADQLGLQTPVYQTAPTAFQAPSLDKYTANPFAAPQASTGNGALDASIAPYLSLLLGTGKDKNQQPQLS